MNTLRISASHNEHGPQTFRATLNIEADTTSVPKFVGLRVIKVSTFNGTPGQADYRPYVEERFNLDINFSTTTRNASENRTFGKANETGARRVRRLLAVAEAQGWTIEWLTPYTNSYPTLAAFLAAIN